MSFHSFLANVSPSIELAYAEQATATTPYITPFTEGWDRFCYLVYAGAVGTTIDAKVVQAKDAVPTDSKDVTDVDAAVLDIVQLVAADDGVLVTLDLGPGALDDTNGYDHIACTVTAAGTCSFGVFGFRYKNRYPGAFDHETEMLADHSAQLFARGLNVELAG